VCEDIALGRGMLGVCLLERADNMADNKIDSAYLSGPNPNHTSLPAVLEQLFEDLNSYSETSIPLDGFNSLEVKLFPFGRSLKAKWTGPTR
jgi:hypothetical protein